MTEPFIPDEKDRAQLVAFLKKRGVPSSEIARYLARQGYDKRGFLATAIKDYKGSVAAGGGSFGDTRGQSVSGNSAFENGGKGTNFGSDDNSSKFKAQLEALSKFNPPVGIEYVPGFGVRNPTGQVPGRFQPSSGRRSEAGSNRGSGYSGSTISDAIRGAAGSIQLPKQNKLLGFVRNLFGGNDAPDVSAAQQKLLKNLGSATGVLNRYAGERDARNAAGGASMDSPFPTGGGYQDIQAPVVAARDFSGEANRLASEAYGPLYQAINAAKTGAQGQYSTSDTVVRGLYDKLVADTKAAGIEQAAQYDQSAADAGSRSRQLQDRTGQIYQDSANSQAALMKSLGQEQAAPDILRQNTAEQAFQQSEAAAGGTAQQNYYGAQKQGAQDYATNLAGANNTAGTVARENLVRDLSSVLQQYDQQELGARSQQANTALDLANQLSSRDLDLQQANASNFLSTAGMNQQGQQSALSNAQNAWQMQYQQGRDQRSDFENDRNYGLQENQFKADTAAALAQAQGEAGATGSEFKFDDLPVMSQISAQAAALGAQPGQEGEYLALLNQVSTDIQGSGEIDGLNTQSFALRIGQLAQQKNLSPGIAASLAAEFWRKILNRN